MKNKFFVVDVCEHEEWDEGSFDTKEEAVEQARSVWRAMHPYDRKKSTIEVRQYMEDVEDPDCDCWDYDTVDWDLWYAVLEESTDAWDYGSYDYDEAVEMLKEQGKGQIAVIRIQTNYCESEISFEEVKNNEIF